MPYDYGGRARDSQSRMMDRMAMINQIGQFRQQSIQNRAIEARRKEESERADWAQRFDEEGRVLGQENRLQKRQWDLVDLDSSTARADETYRRNIADERADATTSFERKQTLASELQGGREAGTRLEYGLRAKEGEARHEQGIETELLRGGLREQELGMRLDASAQRDSLKNVGKIEGSKYGKYATELHRLGITDRDLDALGMGMVILGATTPTEKSDFIKDHGATIQAYARKKAELEAQGISPDEATDEMVRQKESGMASGESKWHNQVVPGLFQSWKSVWDKFQE